MVSVDESDRQRAGRTTEAMFSGIEPFNFDPVEHDAGVNRALDEALRSLDGAEGRQQREQMSVAVSDVIEDVRDFVRDLELAESLGIGLPIVPLDTEGRYILVGLSTLLPDLGLRPSYLVWRRVYLDPFGADLEREYLSDWILQSVKSAAMDTTEMESAIESMRLGVVEHLAVRFAAFREYVSGLWPEAVRLRLRRTMATPQVPTPGANFVVTSASQGLRVFWSGAYRIRGNYFGAPTTPVVGPLQAGTYVFGVDGGAYGASIQWDMNAVVSVPGNASVHLHY